MGVPGAVPDVVWVVTRHCGGASHGAQLCVMGVRVMVVGVTSHGCQVGAAVHASKVRGSVGGGVSLGIAGGLVVGHGIGRHSRGTPTA